MFFARKRWYTLANPDGGSAIISIIAVSVWIDFSPAADEGVTWTILSNFAAFSLWQIGSTHFERSEGYAELLRASIAKQAKLYFRAE